MPSGRYHLSATPLPYGDAPIDVWIEGGRISFRPLDGAVELAAPGGFMLPGLVDCHVHLTVDFGRTGLPVGSAELVEAARRTHLAAGTLLLRDIGSVSDAALRLSYDDGLPRVQGAGRYLAPVGGYGGSQQPVDPAGLAIAATTQARAGAPWVKIIGDWPRAASSGGLPELQHGLLNYPADAMGAAVAAAHAAGARVAVHALKYDSIAAAVAGGVDSVEHGLELDDDLLALMAARGIAWTPTLAGFQATRRSAERRGQTELQRWLEGCVERLRCLLPRAQALGIPILAGTDVFPAGTIAREVVALQQIGLSPEAALAAASTTPRSFLGEPGLEEGASADLVLYPGDPRSTPELLERPALVMLAGNLVGREAGKQL